MSKNTRNRILLTAVAALLLVVMAVGGTLAWLVDTTDTVENTFTAAGIDIDLTETPNDAEDIDKDGKTDEWVMQMIPGTVKTKDPIVSVNKATTVDIWLYVKFENSAPADLTYTSNLSTTNGWTQGTAADVGANVWYRKVTAEEIAKTAAAVAACTDDACAKKENLHWHLLLDDEVSVATTAGATSDTINGGSMKWTAYAIQVQGANNVDMTFDVAWEQLNTQENAN